MRTKVMKKKSKIRALQEARMELLSKNVVLTEQMRLLKDHIHQDQLDTKNLILFQLQTKRCLWEHSEEISIVLRLPEKVYYFPEESLSRYLARQIIFEIRKQRPSSNLVKDEPIEFLQNRDISR